MASSLLSEKGRVRLEGARIGETEWNGEDGTLSADYCKWHRLMDQYYVSSYFFTRRKEHSALKR